MKRWSLAVALVLGCAGSASADYVILMVNLSGASRGGGGILGAGGGNVGVPGGAMGVPGGAMGVPGGAAGGVMGVPGGAVGAGGVPPGGALGAGGVPPGGVRPPGGIGGVPPGGAFGVAGVPGGAAGVPGGALGAGGIPPGGVAGVPPGGVAGVPPGGAFGVAGVPPGGAAGVGGMRPPAGAAGMPAGAAGMPAGAMGMPGGAMGMPGGAMGMPGAMRGMPGGAMGMPGGILGGLLPGLGGIAQKDVDDNAHFIVAVVEVENATAGDYLKKLDQFQPITVRHKWGTAHLRAQTAISKTILLRDGGKPMPAVSVRYAQVEFPKVFGSGTPEPAKVLELAGWCLEHGLVGKFAEVMDKLVDLDKTLPAAVAYTKVKAALKQPPEKNDTAGAWRAKLMETYRITEKEGYHYALVHSSSAGSAADLEQILETLENTFKGFYYWWAWRGIDLPVPRVRQLAILTDKADELNRFHRILTSGPMVGDGFYARREGLAVLSSRRLDESYDALEKFSQTHWWSKGFVKEAVLTGQKGAGVPKLADQDSIWDAEMAALLLKAMETEAQRTTVSHDASRQLLYAAGLLPRNVSAPEWFLFGMGSFFETSPQSPWPTIGAPSFYWQPLFKELKADNKLKTPYETLRTVVTDGYFRSIPPPGEPDSPLRRLHDDAQRKARTTSWALTFWLAREKLGELQRYCKELSKLPRDLELDESTLWETFARAMGAVDASNKPDAGKLAALANQWFNYMHNTTLDSEGLRKQIKEYYKDNQQMIQKQPAAGAPGVPGGAPGLPGGIRPPG